MSVRALATGFNMPEMAGSITTEGDTARLPSLAVAVQAFATLGNRPEEMLKALRHLGRHLPREAIPTSICQ